MPLTITSIDIYKFNIGLKYKIVVPIGEIQNAENVLIRINTNNPEIFGWGEASPFGPITGGIQTSNFAAAQYLAHVVLGKNPLAIENLVAEMKRVIIHESSIRSAFDMALYDILGKKANLPLYKLLGGELREIYTDKTIGMQETVEGTLIRVRELMALGFKMVKLKVGRPNLEDVDHIRAVRQEVGPDIAIKIDSNQGWDYPSAVANLKAMEPYHLQYSEQPLAVWDYQGLKRLRNAVSTPICADESVFDEHDAFKLTAMDAVDYLNIKLGKSGGIHTALKINAIAESCGAKCMIGCFIESRLGLTAAAHLAMARPNIHFLDLDAAYGFLEDPIIGGMRYETAKKDMGLIHLPTDPGLGLDVDPEFLAKLDHVQIK